MINITLAFDEFMQIFLPGLLSFAKSYIKDRSIAEEIIEDVFFTIWINREILPSLKNLSGYLYTSTKNASLRYISNKGNIFENRVLNIDDFGDSILYKYVTEDTTLLGNELLSRINFIVEQFPPRRKLIFRLIKDEQLRYAEVADLLEISVKAVEKQMTLAYENIANFLKREYPEYNLYFSKVSKK